MSNNMMQLLPRCQVTSKSVHSTFLYVLYTNRKKSTIWVFLHLLQGGDPVAVIPCRGETVAAAGLCEELELDLLFGVVEFPFSH